MTDQQRKDAFFARLKDAASALPTGPRRREREGPAALSFAQRSLWFLDRVESGLPTYNIGCCYRLRGALDVAALRGSLAGVVARHDALRTYTVNENDGPVQMVVDAIDVPLPVVEVTGPDAVTRGFALAEELARQPFDLSTPPLWRAAVFQVGPDDHIFAFLVHHIVFDGWSVGVFTEELEAGYRAARGDGPPPAPPAIQYADFAEWQREQLRGPALDRLTGYWRRRLADAPVFELPSDRPRPTQLGYSGALASRDFAPDLSRALTELARGADTTVYAAYVTAFAAVLHRYSGSTDVIFGSPTASRSNADVASIIGFLINMLVVRADVSGDPTFGELLDRMKVVINEALDHGDLPFERLVDAVRPPRDPSRSPLFQIAFTFQNASDTALSLPGLEAEEHTLDFGTSRFDMSWNLYHDDAGTSAVVEFNTDLYDPATIEDLLTHFERMLRAMVTDPGGRVADAPMLTDGELSALLHDYDGPKGERPDAAIVELFEERVDAAPQAVAVTGDGYALGYDELDRAANRLAHRLRELGAGPGRLVAICLPRVPDLTVAMLAVLKSGAGYVPLDPAHPTGRLAGILEDAEPVAVIATGDAADRLDGHGATVVRPDDDLSALPETRPERLARPDDVAYVLYTSGSTGRPKGVPITHRNVVNFIGTVQDLFELTPRDCVLGYAAAVFDVSVFETFSALLTGARLRLTTDTERLDINSLQRILATEGVTVIDMPPSVMELLDPEPFHDLRIAFVGGEAFSGELVNRWNKGRRFFNGYGPTECTVTMIIEECHGHWTGTPPIGLPMANHVAHVLDAKLNPVPYGVPGELVIGGGGLARGYLNRDELTAEKFVKDPFGTAPDGRLYRTGDLVKRRRDGHIEFLGRIDTQVKIRGLRIELGEIEAVLADHPSVRIAVADARPDPKGDRHLVGYIVPAEGRTIDPTALRTHLAVYLPAYMIPNFFVELDEVPLSASGKVDRARLPAPDTERHERITGPRNETERIVAEEIFGPLLGVETPDVHESFFLAGGNSLQATQLIFRASQRFGVEVALADFFREPTLAHLAVLIDRAALAKLGEEEQIRRLETMSDEEVGRLLGDAPSAAEPAPEPGKPVMSLWEELVASALAEELGLPDVLPEDAFLVIGGHSMAAVRTIAALERACGVAIPILPFMTNSTVAELAETLHQAAVEHLGADAVAALMAEPDGETVQ